MHTHTPPDTDQPPEKKRNAWKLLLRLRLSVYWLYLHFTFLYYACLLKATAVHGAPLETVIRFDVSAQHAHKNALCGITTNDKMCTVHNIQTTHTDQNAPIEI